MYNIHKIHFSINTLKISISEISEISVMFKKVGTVTVCVSLLSGIFTLHIYPSGLVT